MVCVCGAVSSKNNCDDESPPWSSSGTAFPTYIRDGSVCDGKQSGFCTATNSSNGRCHSLFLRRIHSRWWCVRVCKGYVGIGNTFATEVYRLHRFERLRFRVSPCRPLLLILPSPLRTVGEFSFARGVSLFETFTCLHSRRRFSCGRSNSLEYRPQTLVCGKIHSR